MPNKETMRIFVSSPGDVGEEREIARAVLQRLRGEFATRAILEPIFWEHEPLLATESFQEQIVRPSEADLVVTILWSRLGTRLPPDFSRPDGTRYNSGTEFEFEDALRSFRERGRPDLLVYRKTAEPLVTLDDKQALLERLSQREALDAFVERWFHDRSEGTLVAAFHPFPSADRFEELLELHVRELIERRLPARERTAATASATWRKGSPYRGLESFEFEHAPVFFGRTRAVSEILDRLRRQAADDRAFVLVLGMSGSGKSSVVKAGVVPMLTRPNVIEGVRLWRRAVMRPGDSAGDLAAGLAAALLQKEALPELDPEGRQTGELEEVLREAPKSAVPLLRNVLSQITSNSPADAPAPSRMQARLILVIDQLEEMFTLENVTADERQRFLAAIDSLARSRCVWIVATLRSDFYPRCAESELLAALKEGDGQYDLAPPRPAEIAQMITQPTLAAGLRFERDPTRDEGLDDLLRDAAAHHPGSLPLLEFALEELYNQRSEEGLLTLSAYQEMGGLEGALARRAEVVFAGLAAPVQAAFPRVMRALIRVGADENERPSSKTADLTSASPESRRFVEALVNARLFVSELSDDGRPVVRLAHEALLRHWPRLSEWLEEDRQSLRAQARISSGAARWREGDRAPDYLLQEGRPLEEGRELLKKFREDLPELEQGFVRASLSRARRRLRLKRAAVASLAVLAIAAGTAAFLAATARDEAERRRGQAEDLIGYMVVDLREKLEPVGRLEILDGVGEQALDYFASVSEERHTDRELLLRARVLSQIGDLRMTRGDLAAAMQPLEQSLTLTRALHQRSPDDTDRLFALGQSHFWIGSVLWEQGDLAGAFDHMEAYNAIALQLVGNDPLNLKWQEELAYAESNIGSLLQSSGQHEEALESFRRGLRVFGELASGDPDRQDWQLELASAHHAVGEALRATGELKGALAHFRSDLRLLEQLLGKNPRDVRLLERTATAHNFLGSLLVAFGQVDRAHNHFLQQRLLATDLTEVEPENAHWLFHLASAHLWTAETLQRNHRSTEALQQVRKGLSILERLAALDESNVTWQLAVAQGHLRLARVESHRQQAPSALQQYNHVLELLERLLKSANKERESALLLAEAYVALGTFQHDLDATSDAQASCARALELLTPLAIESHDFLLLDPWVRALLLCGRRATATTAIQALSDMRYQDPDYLGFLAPFQEANRSTNSPTPPLTGVKPHAPVSGPP